MLEPRELAITQLDIEVYDWKTGDYVADFSNILTDGLRIRWKLNDTEEFDFGLDYEQFKIKCKEMGVHAKDVLSPGVHDIRVRYNGKYIAGGHVVSVEVKLNNVSNSTFQVKCLGFLDLFRDQVTNNQYSHMTYAQIARSLVADTQKMLAINKTHTPAVNTSGWFIQGKMPTKDGRMWAADIRQYAVTVSPVAHNTFCTLATRLNIPAGSHVNITWRQKLVGCSGGAMLERREVGRSSDQIRLMDFTPQQRNGTWVNMSLKNYYTESDSTWICVEAIGGTAATLQLTDFKVTYAFDKDEYYDQKVWLGQDSASSLQTANRQRGYELQNVKQAITALTRLENDNFDFEFTPDRQFNTYLKKGGEKLDVEVTYPGNIDGGSVRYSVTDMVNYSHTIGTGIGDARIEVATHNGASRDVYGTRLDVKTLSDVKLFNTLYEHSLGDVQVGHLPEVIPSVSIGDASLNPLTIETGDTIMVRMENDPYLENITQKYRITGISWSIDNDMNENMSLELVRASIPQKEPVMIRYIKDTLDRSTANAGNHWVQIEAIEMDGDREINRALGKPVTAYPAAGFMYHERITNGNTAANDYAYSADGVKTAVTVDLGRPYPIDYVRVRHYYGDPRRYNTDGCSVGLENKPGLEPLDIKLWGHWNYMERPEGRKSRWIQLENT